VVVVFQVPSGQSYLAGIQGNPGRAEKKVPKRVQSNFCWLPLGDRSHPIEQEDHIDNVGCDFGANYRW